MHIMLSDTQRLSLRVGTYGLSLCQEAEKVWGPEPSRKSQIELAKRSAGAGYVPKGGWRKWKPSSPWPTGTYWTIEREIQLDHETARHLGQMLLDNAAPAHAKREGA